MKQSHIWLISFLVILIDLITGFTGILKAQAGGFGGSGQAGFTQPQILTPMPVATPTPISTSDSIPNTTAISDVSVINISDWKNWSNPYWANNNVCRENGVNLICLPPQIAKKFFPFIPAQTSTTKY